MEDPSSQNLLQFVLLFILTLLNAFSQPLKWAMVSLNRSLSGTKGRRGRRTLHSFVKGD